MKIANENLDANNAFIKAHKDLVEGVKLMEGGMYEDATQLIISSINNYFYNEMSHVQLAVALHKLGHVDWAITQINNAIPYFPESLFLQLIKHELLWFESENSRWTENNRQLAERLNVNSCVSKVEGKRVLITWDGLGALRTGDGDFIQYARCLKYLAGLASSISISINDRFDGVQFLHGIPINSNLVDCREFDICIPISMLLLLVGKEVLCDTPSDRYVDVKASYLEKWDRLMQPRTKPRIGLCWHGALDHPDQDRFFHSSNLHHLLAVDEYEFFSLQKAPHPSYASELIKRKCTDFTHHINTYGDTAALIEMLDVVVSVDTSIAHLAGAMGKPVIVMRPPYPKIPWLPGNRAWYKSATVFRKIGYGWLEVVDRVIAELPCVIYKKMR